MNILKLIGSLLLIAVLSYEIMRDHHFIVEVPMNDQFPVDYEDALSLENGPIQNRIQSKARYHFKEYSLVPKATYQVDARVLSKCNYKYDSSARLSPTDLALGWGPMSRNNVLRQIKIQQHNRFFFWSCREFPIPRKQIETSSANTHILAANKDVDRTLKKIRKSDIIRMRGHLVYIDGKKGWKWKSSLTRQDTGFGACEVILVHDLRIVKK